MWLTFSIQKSADRNSCRRVENEMEPTFWDIAGPIALLSLPISLVLSIYFFCKKRIVFIFICSIVTVICHLLLWSMTQYLNPLKDSLITAGKNLNWGEW